MPTYHHGIKITEVNTGARVIVAASTAIIGLLCTAPSADDDVFPLNRPVLVTDIRAAMASAGTDGTLLKALSAIADQVDPIMVVVRVEVGDTDAETKANLIGGNSTGQATDYLRLARDYHTLLIERPVSTSRT